MNSGYKRLGDYIKRVNVRNKDNLDIPLMGLSVNKVFIPSIANTIGTNMANYKVIERDYFVYGPVTSRNGEKITIALFKDYDEALISQAYVPFKIIKPKELLPDYLMMWFSRPEFDRYARYHSHGSARETFDWDAMCDVELPVPSLAEQQKIIDQYHSVENKIKTNEAICEKLEAAAQALYKHWFIDFEFPYSSSPEKGRWPQAGGVFNSPDKGGDLQTGRVINSPHQRRSDWPREGRLHNVSYLKTFRKELRNNLTPAEATLWKLLKGKQLDGRKFRRQHSVGNYILDFYCPSEKLAVELDGEIHNQEEQKLYDEERDLFLLEFGIKVLRIENKWVFKSEEMVLDAIRSEFGWVNHPLPSNHPWPLLEKEGSWEGYKSSGGKMIWNEELEKEIPEGWRVGKLEDLCDYSKKRIPVKNLSLDNYISTENMLPDRGGVTIANNLPNASTVTNFNLGNVLISNIRPYFKKIWLTEFNGGCSNDVLCLVPKNKTFITYLYQLLEKDIFFDFVMAGSKGTKMPRGDKEWIMGYQIIIPNEHLVEEYERAYTSILQNKKSKLEQNQKLRQLQKLLLSRMVKSPEL